MEARSRTRLWAKSGSSRKAWVGLALGLGVRTWLRRPAHSALVQPKRSPHRPPDLGQKPSPRNLLPFPRDLEMKAFPGLFAEARKCRGLAFKTARTFENTQTQTRNECERIAKDLMVGLGLSKEFIKAAPAFPLSVNCGRTWMSWRAIGVSFLRDIHLPRPSR